MFESDIAYHFTRDLDLFTSLPSSPSRSKPTQAACCSKLPPPVLSRDSLVLKRAAEDIDTCSGYETTVASNTKFAKLEFDIN